MTSQNTAVGLFPVTYRIQSQAAGQPLLGAPVLTVQLLVNTVDKSISGVGTTFQATHPPLNQISFIKGDWSYMATMKSVHILVVADGVSPSPILINGAPISSENLRLRLSLTEDWQAGFANFSYLNHGEWVEINGATVSIVEQSPQAILSELSEQAQQHKPSI